MLKAQPGIVFGGLLLFVMGTLLILDALGLLPGGLPAWLPGLPLLLGLMLLIQYGFERRQRAGLLFSGALLLGIGLFVLAFHLGFAGLNWARFWPYSPILLLILAGAAALVYLLGEEPSDRLLRAVYLIGGLGLALLPFTLGAYRSSSFRSMLTLWPLLFIPLALALFTWMQGSSDGIE